MRPGELIHKVCSQTFAGAARIIRSILRMEFFFIIILAIAVFVVWLRNKDATSSQREDIARLEREIDFLKSQLGALIKAQAASLASAGPAAARTSAGGAPACLDPDSYSPPCPAARGCGLQTPAAYARCRTASGHSASSSTGSGTTRAAASTPHSKAGCRSARATNPHHAAFRCRS